MKIIVLISVATYIAVAFNVVQAYEGLSFNYAPLGNHTETFLIPIGDVVMHANSIDLTAATNTTASGFQNLTGRLFHSERLQLWNRSSSQHASFNCSFSFHLQQYPGSEYSAEGLAFVLVRPFLSPFLMSGAWLGLFDSPTTNLVAIEFDTFQNKAFLDPNENHIGIDFNNIISNVTQNTLGFALYNTTTFAWIDYSSPHSSLLVYATNVENVKPVTPQLSFNVDLSKHLPEQVFIGFSAATGSAAQHHTLLSWNFSTAYHVKSSGEGVSSLVKSSGKGVSLLVTKIIVPIAAVLALILTTVVMFRRKHGIDRPVRQRNYISKLLRRHQPALQNDHRAAGVPRTFTYKELSLATKSFSQAQLLGKGGFGNVYKGVLYDERDGSAEEIAVKCVSQDAGQGEKEFAAEISIISRIRHRNLVQLKGWCREKKQLMLVYEFLSNGSLDYHLYPKDKRAQPTLDCQARFHIMCGVGYALQYLHEECEKVIVHRDLKPSNVILDSTFTAKLGDFGLARQLKEGESSYTTNLAGTRGYMAPECVMSQRVTMNGDVYGYGAMLLEVACGRHPIDKSIPEEFEWKLVDWVWSLYCSSRLNEAMDTHLSLMDPEVVDILTRMMIVGLACSHPNQTLRPKISEALGALLGRIPMLTIPLSQPWCPFYQALSTSSGNINDHSIPSNSLELLKSRAQHELTLMTLPR